MNSYKNGKFLGTEIIVNVYDLNESNNYLYDYGLGAYHSGVEIMGSEWSFSTQGINPSEPRSIPELNLRDSISMGRSKLTVSQIEDIIYGMKKDYPGDSYHVLSKNCNCFSNDLCERIGVGPIPGYINRMARWGSICSCLYPSNDVEPPVYTVSNFEGHGHKLSNENADESKNEDNEDSPLIRREKIRKAMQNRLHMMSQQNAQVFMDEIF